MLRHIYSKHSKIKQTSNNLETSNHDTLSINSQTELKTPNNTPPPPDPKQTHINSWLVSGQDPRSSPPRRDPEAPRTRVEEGQSLSTQTPSTWNRRVEGGVAGKLITLVI